MAHGWTGRWAALTLCGGLAVGAMAAGVLSGILWADTTSDPAALGWRARLLPADVDGERVLARLALAEGRLDDAESAVARAERLAPLSAGPWLDAGELALRRARAGEVAAAVGRATRLAPAEAAVCRQAAFLLLQTGAEEAAGPLLGCVLRRAPERTDEVLSLARAVYGTPARVVDLVVPDHPVALRTYLRWAYAAHDRAAAVAGFTALARQGATLDDSRRQIDFLIDAGAVTAADGLWQQLRGPRPPGLVYDGTFDRVPDGFGFGWVLAPFPGGRATVAAGERAAGGTLRVLFRGGNLDFHHVSQVVPVTGGHRYRLRARGRAEGVTSLAGPRLRVEGHPACPGLPHVEGAELRETRDWHDLTVEFETPPACEAVVVRLRRSPTRRLDRELHGTIELDDVRLLDLGPAPT